MREIQKTQEYLSHMRNEPKVKILYWMYSLSWNDSVFISLSLYSNELVAYALHL